MKKPPENYENWLTKAEAAQALQCAEKTIEREAARGKIQQAWRRIPGRRPIAVFNPDDIERLQVQTVRAFPAPAADTSKALARIAPASSEFFAGLAAAIAAPRMLPMNKLHLSLAEAAEYTGFGVVYLRRQIAAGKIAVVKGAGPHGADVIRRTDLDKLGDT
jgi:muconolactone delta-isomerase